MKRGSCGIYRKIDETWWCIICDYLSNNEELSAWHVITSWPLHSTSRVVFTREIFFLFFCFLQSGNLSDSNNPLTKMHTLTHIGHLKYIVEKSMKWSTKFKISSLVIMFILDKLNLAQNMAFFGHLDNYNDQKCHDLS